MELQKRLIRPLAAWLAGLLLCCAPPAALASGGEEAAGEPPQAALTDEDLERTVFARGCVLIDASDPETPLYAKNPDAPIIPASTTKIMTCILAIEMAGDLSAAVAVPDEAARLGGSNSRMGLVRGESLPMRDLLYGLMLVSANDAALAIACHLAGSAEDFAALMNGKAAALGMEDTRFAAPSGVYRSGYTSTAHDMAEALGCAQVRLDARAENACPSDAGQGRLALVADLWGRTAFMRRTDIEAVRSGAAQLSLEPSPDAAWVEAPVFEGEAFGTLNVTLRGRTLFSAPLLASRSVEAYEPAAAPPPTPGEDAPAAQDASAETARASPYLAAAACAAGCVLLLLRRRRRGG